MGVARQLDLGKVRPAILRRSVFPYIPLYRQPTLDAAAVEITGNMVISHNPALGTPLETVGFFAFHYSASNLAMRFARPEYMVVGLNLPPQSTEEDLRLIAKSLGDEAAQYGVKAVGGHTGVYKGLSIPLVSVTCFGKQLRNPVPPSPGDLVVVVGEVGAEAVWLRSLSSNGTDPRGDEGIWRTLTPLSASLSLAMVKDVRLMHDVSEGGVGTALHELAADTGWKLDVKSNSLPYHAETRKLRADLLRIPSYGALIAVVKRDALDKIARLCKRAGFSCTKVGTVRKGRGAYVDGVRVRSIERTELDQIYGSFRSAVDATKQQLTDALAGMERHASIARLIPQVGTSMVYSKPCPESLTDVAGLDGRVVVSQRRPKVCGEVTYGGSKHVGAVLLEAAKLNPAIRAAVNIRGGEGVASVLESMGIRVCRVPSIRTNAACPVAAFIQDTKKLSDAYYHRGNQGIEPSIVILSRTPQQLLDILVQASEHVGNNRFVQ
jgi:hydrogenase maturation factor/predicted fused transcriptional regulator/phosphomethylpyrimidine kinase